MSKLDPRDIPASVLLLARAMDRDLRDELGGAYAGLVLAGSALRREPPPGSDVDLFALHAGDWRQRRVFEKADVKVDLTILSSSELQIAFAAWATPGVLDAFVHGWPVSGDPGRVGLAKAQAEQIWRNGPPRLSDIQRLGIRSRLSGYVDDLADPELDLLRIRHIAMLAYINSIDAFFDTRRRWRPGAKRTLTELRIADCSVLTKAETALNRIGTSDAGGIVTAIAALVDGVLAPVGGRLGSFTTPRQVRNVVGAPNDRKSFRMTR